MNSSMPVPRHEPTIDWLRWWNHLHWYQQWFLSFWFDKFEPIEDET
jgi:hypothetical protein